MFDKILLETVNFRLDHNVNIYFNYLDTCKLVGFPSGSACKESASNARDPSKFLGQEDPLAKG